MKHGKWMLLLALVPLAAACGDDGGRPDATAEDADADEDVGPEAETGADADADEEADAETTTDESADDGTTDDAPSGFVLTVTTPGAGSGTVTSDPPGIDCGADCTELYDPGTVVSLTARPDGLSTFEGWTGDPDCADGEVTLTGPLACVATFGTAAPGTPCPTWGTAGLVTTDLGAASGIGGLVVQPDGKVVAAGTVGAAPTRDIAVARYLPDGTLDATFGVGGFSTADFGADDGAQTAVLQPDGNIVVAGGTGAPEAWGIPAGAFAFARFDTDGSLDPAFALDGRYVYDFGTGQRDTVMKLAVLPDGRILAVGYANANGGDWGDVAVVRLTTDGSADALFGLDGAVLTAFSGLDKGNDIALLPDGRFVVPGTTYIGLGYAQLLARFNAAGDLDLTFSGDGWTSGPGSPAELLGAVLQGDQIIVTGYTGPCSGPYRARYAADGTLDASYQNGATGLGPDIHWLDGLLLQPDGKLVTTAGGCSMQDFALARFAADGSIDAGFGADGVARLDFGGVEGGSSLARLDDGRLLVGGSASGHFAIACVLP
ncbi:MAG: hypothetical protein HY907_16760 [Deltaproteobacteria bacterium]|nr:hypothetical protein [Deltaproteobacteria bacterium]